MKTMDLKLFILSLACLSCLVPPAYSTVVTAGLAAAGAAKSAAVLGAGVLAKGAVLKGAALLAAKAAVVKGLAVLAAKGVLLGGAAVLGAKALKAVAALKAGAALAHANAVSPAVFVEKPIVFEKPVLVEKPLLFHKPHLVHKPVLVQPYAYQVPQPSVVLSLPSPSNIADKLNNLVSVTSNAVANKTAAVGQLLASLLPSKTVVNPPPQPLVYQIVSAPKFYPVPIFEKIVKKK